MKKVSKIVSIVLAVALLLSLNTLAGFAAEEKRVEIPDTENAYFTVSNITEVKQAGYFELFVSPGPVTVTFYGDDLARELVAYLPDSTIDSNGIKWGDLQETVPFTVQKYRYWGEDTIYDEATHPAEDICYYVSGNYVTATKPGYYYIVGSVEASAGGEVFLHITGEAAAENTPAPAPTPTPTPAPSATPEPTPVTPPATQPETLTVSPNYSKVLVNGKEVAFEAYTIEGYNYFKLRDLAMALKGTEKQFEVEWDGANNAIKLTSGKPYTVAGGELAVSANLTAKQARPTNSKIFVDGTDIELTAYTIEGYNYFKLRDIGYFINFAVDYDGAKRSIIIDTTKSNID